MVLCDKCEAQAGRPGYLPPHEDLVRGPVVPMSATATAHTYRCGTCGSRMVLWSPDMEAPDYWALDEGNLPL
jgi:hypothetical protein